MKCGEGVRINFGRRLINASSPPQESHSKGWPVKIKNGLRIPEGIQAQCTTTYRVYPVQYSPCMCRLPSVRRYIGAADMLATTVRDDAAGITPAVTAAAAVAFRRLIVLRAGVIYTDCLTGGARAPTMCLINSRYFVIIRAPRTRSHRARRHHAHNPCNCVFAPPPPLPPPPPGQTHCCSRRRRRRRLLKFLSPPPSSSPFRQTPRHFHIHTRGAGREILKRHSHNGLFDFTHMRAYNMRVCKRCSFSSTPFYTYIYIYIGVLA